jgi:NhaA family Na+:H+ antiporter
MVLCEVLRRIGVKNFWPYLLVGGPLAWLGLFNAGVHASLALVPIIPFMPHAERDAGLFVEDEHAHDTMHDFETVFAPVVDVGLFMFGFANAGVVLTGEALTGSPTWIIFLSLVVGKTVGIPLFCIVAEKFGLSLPEGMKMRELPTLGAIAGIGFTVALFIVAVAGKTYGLPEDDMAMLKLGALMSFGSAGVAYILSWVFDTQYIPADAPEADSAGH